MAAKKKTLVEAPVEAPFEIEPVWTPPELTEERPRLGDVLVMKLINDRAFYRTQLSETDNGEGYIMEWFGRDYVEVTHMSNPKAPRTIVPLHQVASLIMKERRT